MNLDKATMRALERLINDDLKRAAIDSVSVAVDEDGAIVVDELTLRLEDRRIVSIDIGSLASQTLDVKVLVMETYVERDPKRPWVKEGWRRMDVMQDYRDDLADALRPPWRAGDDIDRLEDRT